MVEEDSAPPPEEATPLEVEETLEVTADLLGVALGAETADPVDTVEGTHSLFLPVDGSVMGRRR